MQKTSLFTENKDSEASRGTGSLMHRSSCSEIKLEVHVEVVRMRLTNYLSVINKYGVAFHLFISLNFSDFGSFKAFLPPPTFPIPV